MTLHPAKTAGSETSADLPDAALVTAIAQLGRDASIEISVHDVRDLAASRSLLPAGKDFNLRPARPL